NATTNTLSITAGNTGMDGYLYRCIVSGTCAPNDTSASALLTINRLPAITGQPVDSTICEFNTATFGVDATGTGLTYQWQILSGSSYTDIINGGLYSGANADTLEISGASAIMSGSKFRCIVSGVCLPPATTTDVTLTINTAPVV